MRILPLLLMLGLWLPAQPGGASETLLAGDAVKGEALYARRCGACHSLDRNRVGPRHRGLFGREAGGLADYRYSPALATSNLRWTAESLDLWLQDPEALISGQRMGYRLGSAPERRDIIAFLKAASAEAEASP